MMYLFNDLVQYRSCSCFVCITECRRFLKRYAVSARTTVAVQTQRLWTGQTARSLIRWSAITRRKHQLRFVCKHRMLQICWSCLACLPGRCICRRLRVISRSGLGAMTTQPPLFQLQQPHSTYSCDLIYCVVCLLPQSCRVHVSECTNSCAMSLTARAKACGTHAPSHTASLNGWRLFREALPAATR